jgi:hypothetical protein
MAERLVLRPGESGRLVLPLTQRLGLSLGIPQVLIANNPQPGTGVSFGPWSVNSTAQASSVFARYPWNSALNGAITPGNLKATLDFYAANGWKMVTRLWTDPGSVDAGGTFNLANWKLSVKRYADAGLSSYLNQRAQDGTLIRHLLIDDIHSINRWNRFITPSEIEQMAAYSKSLYPSVPVTLRARATQLLGQNFSALDDVTADYSFGNGGNTSSRTADCTAYRDDELAAAATLGIGQNFGFIVPDGGDGASGIPGSLTGKFFMSASELVTYGNILIPPSQNYWFNFWKWDIDYESIYFDRSDILAAMQTLRDLCDAHA